MAMAVAIGFLANMTEKRIISKHDSFSSKRIEIMVVSINDLLRPDLAATVKYFWDVDI